MDPKLVCPLTVVDVKPGVDSLLANGHVSWRISKIVPSRELIGKFSTEGGNPQVRELIGTFSGRELTGKFFERS